MKRLFLILISALAIINLSTLKSQELNLNLQVDRDKVIHQMKGGIGASWHALIHDIPLNNEKYDYPVRFDNPRGSAFAGNPPLEDTGAWNQLYKHAEWLGLDFIRVELSMHMYEPERNVFDWENDEIQALFRILDWCEANQADVFLQQMWGHVDWNAHAGVHPLLSSPKSLDDFTNGIATLLKYLINTRRYTCIKYFCMTNEPPGGPWGYWWNSGSHQGPSLTEAWKKLYETFRDQGIEIPISGPDWTSLPPCEPSKINFDQYLGAFDIHSYFGITPKVNGEKIIGDWVQFASLKNKPFFISEIGNMNLGWGADNPGPKSFKAALSNASDIALCMNLGVDGFNRWSFINRGDLDGQWQLVNTYDCKSQTYNKQVIPENEAYYGFAMLTRFLGKYAVVISCKSDLNPEGLVTTACKNRDGNVTVLIVNNRKEAVTADLTIKNAHEKQVFYLYQVTELMFKDLDFKLNPQGTYKSKDGLRSIKILPESITVLTTNLLKSSDAGVIN